MSRKKPHRPPLWREGPHPERRPHALHPTDVPCPTCRSNGTLMPHNNQTPRLWRYQDRYWVYCYWCGFYKDSK